MIKSQTIALTALTAIFIACTMGIVSAWSAHAWRAPFGKCRVHIRTDGLDFRGTGRLLSFSLGLHPSRRRGRGRDVGAVRCLQASMAFFMLWVRGMAKQ